MKMKNISLFSVLLILLSMSALPGCATRTDVEAMQSDRQQDLHRIRQLEAELAESKEQLKAEIEKSNDPLREKSADMWAEIQSLRSEIAKMRGEVDSLNIRMDNQVGAADSAVTVQELSKRLSEVEFAMVNELQVDLPETGRARGAAVGAPAAATAATAPADAPEEGVAAQAGAATATAAAQTAPQADSDPAKALYDKAYALYKEGNFERARSYWAEFTDTFKGHAFTPSAVFWQGQCYYMLKDYARAVILYEDVIEKYQKSSKYKAALLRAGFSWEHLGKPELAKMRFEEIIKKFPKSVEATQAKRSLDKMK
ncbi:Outer membrane protein assembly factor BamD [Pseudodesulfovibrio hydrargyri]|uniref:Outer membrane protein assembly factor BamD n=1 Tax=Pseudodesulfovibrio hydrargyri TaxID=2125990 RepID=A0A1J5N6F8_9BACT|nr:tetratricopeptide repeat protein [Pseudodesulfovibrio hydrargyri]OIQ48887.1 Outer membrane protein assembly factor BamD [Pseudodesulfovibrio hydrargyri]